MELSLSMIATGAALLLPLLLLLFTLIINRKNDSAKRPPIGVVSHIIVNVTDLSTSLNFYRTLGLIEVTTDNKSALLRIPKSLSKYSPYLLLRQVDEGRAKPDEWHAAMAGLARICFFVNNIQSYMKEMEKKGLKPLSSPVTDTPIAGGVTQQQSTVVSYQDPQGTIAEFVSFTSMPIRILNNLLRVCGMIEFPVLVHCNVNATSYERSLLAYQQLGCAVELEYGPVKNRLYSAMPIPDPGYTKHTSLIKLTGDDFLIDLIQWDDPKTVPIPVSADAAELPQLGLAAVAISVENVSEMCQKLKHSRTGWTSAGPECELSLPQPLGDAVLQTMLDPDGVQIDLISYKS